VRTVRRGGRYLRVADPSWTDPLDGGHAALRGGRWNPPESYPVVYLCADEAVARANVHRILDGQPYGPEDLRPESAPVLVTATVPADGYLNAVTEAGLEALGLPRTYPRDSRRRRVPWSRCQPLGEQAHAAGLPGVAARSAAGAAGEELAYFGRRKLRRGAVRQFEEWFWGSV
jgi:RES domain-containing protein